MDTENVVYVHNATLFSYKEKWGNNIWKKMNGTEIIMLSKAKPGSAYNVYFHSYAASRFKISFSLSLSLCHSYRHRHKHSVCASVCL